MCIFPRVPGPGLPYSDRLLLLHPHRTRQSTLELSKRIPAKYPECPTTDIPKTPVSRRVSLERQNWWQDVFECQMMRFMM